MSKSALKPSPCTQSRAHRRHARCAGFASTSASCSACPTRVRRACRRRSAGVTAIASCAGQCHCLPTRVSTPSPCPNVHQLTVCNLLCLNSGLAMMIEVRCLSSIAITTTNTTLILCTTLTGVCVFALAERLLRVRTPILECANPTAPRPNHPTPKLTGCASLPCPAPTPAASTLPARAAY